MTGIGARLCRVGQVLLGVLLVATGRAEMRRTGGSQTTTKLAL